MHTFIWLVLHSHQQAQGVASRVASRELRSEGGNGAAARPLGCRFVGASIWMGSRRLQWMWPGGGFGRPVLRSSAKAGGTGQDLIVAVIVLLSAHACGRSTGAAVAVSHDRKARGARPRRARAARKRVRCPRLQDQGVAPFRRGRAESGGAAGEDAARHRGLHACERCE